MWCLVRRILTAPQEWILSAWRGRIPRSVGRRAERPGQSRSPGKLGERLPPRMTIGQKLDGSGITTPAEIGAVLEMPAAEAQRY